MNTLKIIKVFFPLSVIPLFLLLNNCGSRSEYGEANDYEKFGAELIPESTPPEILSVSPTDNSTFNSPATTISVKFSESTDETNAAKKISEKFFCSAIVSRKICDSSICFMSNC